MTAALTYDSTSPPHPLGPLYAQYLDICAGHRARLLVWEFVKSLEPAEQCAVAAHVLNVSVGSYQNHGKSTELSSKRTGARVRKLWREQQKALADAEKLEPMVRKACERMEKQEDVKNRINMKVSLGLLSLGMAERCIKREREDPNGSDYRNFVRSAETDLTLAAMGLF